MNLKVFPASSLFDSPGIAEIIHPSEDFVSIWCCITISMTKITQSVRNVMILNYQSQAVRFRLHSKSKTFNISKR